MNPGVATDLQLQRGHPPDTYGLYNTAMWSDAYGCKIQRSGSGIQTNPYTYAVAPDYANRPVNYVSFWDSCRFANWLQNGQPTGAQNAGTTEAGAYTLTSDGINNNTITRNTGWQWAVTSEDEWYKASYYNGPGGAYYDYPTGTNSVPSNVLGTPTDPGNNATFYNGSLTIGSPYYRTEVGAHENSESAYGTFDQGGNVWEWNEAIIGGSSRGLRGGSWSSDGAVNLLASFRDGYGYPPSENHSIGFRVSEVPEPATVCLLVLGGMAAMARRKKN